MTKYKLTYFDLEARGELIRLIFAAAKVKYEDHRVSYHDEWPKVKSGMSRLILLKKFENIKKHFF